MREAFLNSRAVTCVVILDCCYSGRAIDDALDHSMDGILAQIDVAGPYTIAAAPANGVTLFREGERNTASSGRRLELFRQVIRAAVELVRNDALLPVSQCKPGR